MFASNESEFTGGSMDLTVKSRVIEIGKSRYVGGMFWQVFDKGKVKEESQKVVDEGGYDHVAKIDTNSHVMIGFAGQENTEGGKLDEAVSLSAALYLGVQHETWAGLFQIAEGVWWYTGVRDGYTLPMGDVVSTDPQALVNQFYQDSALGPWDKVYCDSDLLAGSDTVTLESLLPTRIPKAARVRPLGFQMPWKKIGLLTLLAIVGVGGFMAYSSYEEKKRQEAIARAKATREAKLKAQPVVVVLPWQEEMLPSVFARRCFAAIENQQVVINGWRMVSVDCGKTEVSMEFTRVQGSIPMIRQVYRDAEIANTGSSAIVRIPLGEAPKRANEELREWSQARDAMLTFQQRIGVGNGVVPDPSAPPPAAGVPQAPGAPAPMAPSFVKYNWSFNANFAPVEIASALDGIKGVTLSGMKLDVNSFSWNFKGELYGKK